MDLKKKSRPFFIIIFKLKNGNFKTRNFSPLIERVLAGVIRGGRLIKYEREFLEQLFFKLSTYIC